MIHWFTGHLLLHTYIVLRWDFILGCATWRKLIIIIYLVWTWLWHTNMIIYNFTYLDRIYMKVTFNYVLLII